MKDNFKMKICYITAQVPFGIGEVFILEEMLEAKRQGVNLLIIPRSPSKVVFHEECKELLENTIWLPLISLGMIFCFCRALLTKIALWKILVAIVVCSRYPLVVIKNLLVLLKGVFIAEVIGKENIEHIHAHWGSTTSTMAYIVSQMTDLPWSLTLHRWDIKENNMLKEKVKSAKFIRCISEHGQKELLEIVGGEYEERIKVIHMGVKIPASIEQSSGSKKVFTIVTPANFLQVKGHRYLIEACLILIKHDVKNFHCIFYGEGPLRVKLENLIEKKSLTNYVRMPGAIFHEKLIEMYRKRKVDMVILSSINTSKGEHEGIPVSLMEAMAYKIPTISTNTGGILELLSDGAGIVVEEKNSEELANAVETLLKNQKLRDKIGTKGYQRVVEEFNVSTSTARLLKAIKGENLSKWQSN